MWRSYFFSRGGMSMAINTFGISLKWGTSAEQAAKVVDIKDFPDLIGG